MSVLAAEHLHLTFPKQTVPVLQDINLKIEEGTLTVILGESGCGKTTLLNILAGFQKPSSGQIKLDHEVVTAPDARRARGETLGPLDGIPYTAKDSYLVKGLTAASGSPAFKDLVAQRDAFTVERLRAAGAICFGKKLGIEVHL